MLPTTNDEAVVANLNAEFVTDNTLGSGSVEAETNKAEEEVASMEDDESALVEKLRDEGELDSGSSRLVYNEKLTVEGSNSDVAEDDEEPETADNFNESHDEAATTELTKDMNSMQLTQEADAKEERAEKEIVDEAAELTAELDEEATTEVVAVNAEFDAESISISHENQDNDNENGAKYSSMKHSNYAVNKHREDVSSSDEEDAEDAVEMNKEFNEEWDSLAEDLANKNDRDNDLSNDIDIYESAVPVDLSNDLAVNDIAASQPGYPLNPDAEFVDVDGAITNSTSAGQPKFEKLSMNSTSYQNFKWVVRGSKYTYVW